MPAKITKDIRLCVLPPLHRWSKLEDAYLCGRSWSFYRWDVHCLTHADTVCERGATTGLHRQADGSIPCSSTTSSCTSTAAGMYVSDLQRWQPQPACWLTQKGERSHYMPQQESRTSPQALRTVYTPLLTVQVVWCGNPMVEKAGEHVPGFLAKPEASNNDPPDPSVLWGGCRRKRMNHRYRDPARKPQTPRAWRSACWVVLKLSWSASGGPLPRTPGVEGGGGSELLESVSLRKVRASKQRCYFMFSWLSLVHCCSFPGPKGPTSPRRGATTQTPRKKYKSL